MIIQTVRLVNSCFNLELFGVFVTPPILLAILFFICPSVLKWIGAGFK